MDYQIGDQVVHRNYGPGKIIAIDEKQLSGEFRTYYVVEAGELTLWVPIDAAENSIRYPTSETAFKEMLNYLSGEGEPLPEHQTERYEALAARMKSRSLMDICLILRDLTARSRNHLLNRNDNEVFKRAEEYILNEWELAMGTPRVIARQELESLLNSVGEAQS
jgi:CarD family transcriptional regulator